MKLLLVEDDETLIAALTKLLAAQHYVVDVVRDGEMGWNYGSTFEYDLLILDLILPKLDGISLCKRLRAEGYTTPILLLTSENANMAKVQGLDAGADDYVVKPFDTAELIARIRALVRRGSTNPFPLLMCGDLLLNPSTCEISYGGQPLNLTTKEYELLELLLRDSQHVISTTEILDRLWSSEEFPSEATVRSHIRRVRRKLAMAGAPADFIATMHGRGYYLKPPETDELSALTPSSISTTERLSTTADLLQAGLANGSGTAHPPANTQQQYLAFLNDTWKTTRPKSLEQIAVLWQATVNLQTSQLTSTQQNQAKQVAHTLAGTIGIFGLTKAMHAARQLEHWLKQEPLQPKHVPIIQALVIALQQEIHAADSIESAHVGSLSPQVLIVSPDPEFDASLATVAANRGIHAEVVALHAFDTATLPPTPDVLVFQFPSDSAVQVSTTTDAECFSILERYAQHYPAVPILVIGDRFTAPWNTTLTERLEVMRWGGKLFLESSTTPNQILSAAMRLAHNTELAARVMIVDDDLEWLRMLPTLLKPWGFKVTTLDDPQHFLTVLQAVTPDVLVLDVNMPQINGFELCQVLRSDPHWQRLPVLFLSVLTDLPSQNQAFSVGADDYLIKPIKGKELANRILCRLQRVRAWVN